MFYFSTLPLAVHNATLNQEIQPLDFIYNKVLSAHTIVYFVLLLTLVLTDIFRSNK